MPIYRHTLLRTGLPFSQRLNTTHQLNHWWKQRHTKHFLQSILIVQSQSLSVWFGSRVLAETIGTSLLWKSMLTTMDTTQPRHNST